MPKPGNSVVKLANLTNDCIETPLNLKELETRFITKEDSITDPSNNSYNKI